MSKTNKELVTELTISFINSWNSCGRTKPIDNDGLKDVFNTCKQLIESMDEKETK
ncbi:hypothetical protein [Clostridium sartagoforme]|uniref:hypothetical protein n=1 Tax=Clostridium sartagoforme TaxID=84031 RepID=UPI0003A36DC7|nr:hypothetical protein [Clostridium sartagoforme]